MKSIPEQLQDHLSNINVPGPNSKVFKDECVYSFNTPFTDTGLYVCLKTFYGLSKEHLERHYRKTGSCVYVHLKFEKILLEQDEHSTTEEKKVTRLAIGVEGGFDTDPVAKKFETQKNYSVVIFPHLNVIPWPNDNLPEKLINAVNGIINSESAHKLIEMELSTWDGEKRIVSKHTHNLLQLKNNKRIPPSGWKCERCDLTSNLWLNLTDGSILCGRKFFDGSGGNEHALHHYKETKYPLAVKLGTITKEGKGDVFSYDEDDMVEDPYLIEHLAHFGINISNMVKTDKSMIELELDLNQKFGEWSAIQEAGSNLQRVYGPGYTGLMNLGNSCYLNSTIQVIFAVPDFVEKYAEKSFEIFDRAIDNPPEDFNTQMAKLGYGLCSGRYSQPPENEYENSFSVSPTMFRNVISRNHPVFSSKNQQDAQEFLLHLLSTVQRNSRNEVDPTQCFKFQVEERYQCHASKKVQYQYRDDYCLPLMIPMEAAINKEEVTAFASKQAQNAGNENKSEHQEIMRPIIEFSSCLNAFVQDELVDQFYSSAIKEKTTAFKTTRLSKFSRYLFIHLKKYTLREDWTPMKLDVCVDMPDVVDLAILRGYGVQPGEELLPVDDDQPAVVHFNEQYLRDLTEMGFPLNACKRALHATNNESLDNATTWLMEHIDDPTIMEPFTLTKKQDFLVKEEALEQIMNLGFSRNHAITALRETNNNIERAADWIFNHPEESDDVEMAEESQLQDPAIPDETNFQYQLRAFISHMGPSTAVGHYVCHILKDGKWVIFNDEKVALSENPPKGLGYVYLYERI